MSKYFILALMFVLSTAEAHEGHDHASGAAMAPHGGYMQSLETAHLEFVSLGSGVKIYLYDKDMTPKDVRQTKASATMALPRKAPQSISLKEKGDHWEAGFDSRGAHRVTLELSIHQGGHEDKVRFTVEPKND